MKGLSIAVSFREIKGDMQCPTPILRPNSSLVRLSQAVRPCSLAPPNSRVTPTLKKLYQSKAACLTQSLPRARLNMSASRVALDETRNLHSGGEADQDQWKYEAPYKEYKAGEGFDSDDIKHEASCHCGRVQYQLNR